MDDDSHDDGVDEALERARQRPVSTSEVVAALADNGRTISPSGGTGDER